MTRTEEMVYLAKMLPRGRVVCGRMVAVLDRINALCIQEKAAMRSRSPHLYFKDTFI